MYFVWGSKHSERVYVYLFGGQSIQKGCMCICVGVIAFLKWYMYICVGVIAFKKGICVFVFIKVIRSGMFIYMGMCIYVGVIAFRKGIFVRVVGECGRHVLWGI